MAPWPEGSHAQALCGAQRVLPNQGRAHGAGVGRPRRATLSPLPSAGAFSLLRENFSHAPSPDMSPASLSMLEQLMTAQAQECVFEGLSLQAPVALRDCLAQLHLAQEAAQVRAGARPSCGVSVGSRAWVEGAGRSLGAEPGSGPGWPGAGSPVGSQSRLSTPRS